jgi:hypothetical protein
VKKQVKLDPFNYGTMDVVTTLVQLAVAVAGVILAAKGDTSALLGLGALAGGAKGNLLGDLLRVARNNTPRFPKPPMLAGTLLALVLAMSLVLMGCGTTVSRQFIVDSQAAVLETSSDYLGGCRTVTVAPAFSVDWNQNVSFGGGLFAGCEAEGKLAEFRCVGIMDDTTGKTRIECQPLSLWKREEGTP